MKSIKIAAIVLFTLIGQAWGQNIVKSPITPFVAVFEKEKHQVLPDGNTINKVESGPYYRDRNGRSRLEIGNLIFISDPVAGSSYVLDTLQKTARVIDHKSVTAQASTVRKIELDRDKMADPTAVVSTQSANQLTANASDQPAPNKRALGNKTIEGLNCEGRVITYTVPANSRLGNTYPIESTTEIWISNELLVAVLSINEDPRLGKTVQRFKNIKPGINLDPALFKVPENYKVVDK
jgi:hypothetical protein